ncbi:FAD/NAD(P)-binding domain-containing protein [Polychaeton citri CBS 116435]|uniref:FAD/NAD(P)-binding domain-containing protein n=1 Tax=Polychaeton citri CBS 116435 TaxID=1314669 RepID=A0A9P4Q4S7_9PEZI|nr:FAD/NAD(P)-binding domain-containing protein [Polychaeton citri CBS 116435]
MTPAIAILGGGPSGLALARLLEVKNIDYVVFERDSSPTSVGQGGSLDVHTNSGQLALKECGLFDEFKALARYDGQAFKAVDKDCNVICDQGHEGQDGKPEIDRKDLRRILLNSVPTEKIRWGCKIESVSRESDDSMAVRFANGDVQSGFNLVVGADGAWSKARSLLTPAKPHYSGLCFIQASISKSNPFYSTTSTRVGPGMYFALTSGKAIIAQRMGDGSYMVYAGLRLPEHWTKTNADFFNSPAFREQLVTSDYADWSSDITDFIKNSDDEPLRAWPLYSLPTESLPWESVPGVTLVGDAAHLATPNGEGVNCAMYDSLQLVQKIVQYGLDNLAEATKRYEEEMFPRGVEHIRDGENLNGMFYAEDSPVGFRQWAASVGMQA